MVKLSVILFLLASVVLSALEAVAPIEEMAMVQAESTNKVRELRLALFSVCYRSISQSPGIVPCLPSCLFLRVR
jgi:hypothetical protein